ncbi:MAG: hypothetical protein VB110_10075 [Bacteroidales bacterium]|nr:hypothetical protein [Bacteroidales bacterium]
MKKIIGIISLFLVFSCDNDSSLLIDPISDTRYYQNEIFTDSYLRFYGKWQFSYIYDDSGIVMNPQKIDPTYDYLEIKKYGIYGKIKNNKIIESGKIQVLIQDNSQFEINLKPDNTDKNIIENLYNVHFTGNTMEMYDTSVGCGILYNVYKKIR